MGSQDLSQTNNIYHINSSDGEECGAYGLAPLYLIYANWTDSYDSHGLLPFCQSKGISGYVIFAPHQNLCNPKLWKMIFYKKGLFN